MGLDAGTPVGAGLIDAHAGRTRDPRRAALEGATRPIRAGGLALILGTSSSCMALSDEPRFVDSVWGPHFGALTWRMAH